MTVQLTSAVKSLWPKCDLGEERWRRDKSSSVLARPRKDEWRVGWHLAKCTEIFRLRYIYVAGVRSQICRQVGCRGSLQVLARAYASHEPKQQSRSPVVKDTEVLQDCTNRVWHCLVVLHLWELGREAACGMQLAGHSTIVSPLNRPSGSANAVLPLRLDHGSQAKAIV